MSTYEYYRSTLLRSKKIICILLFLSTTLLAQQRDELSSLKNLRNLPRPDSSLMFSSVFITNEKPSIISTYRPSANTKMRLTAIASSNLDKGKILLFGSSAYFKKPMVDDPEVSSAIDNILAWANTAKTSKQPLIGTYGDHTDDLVQVIKDKSKPYKIDEKKILKNTTVIFVMKDITDSLMLKDIERYVRNGGTLVFGSPYSELKYRYDNTATNAKPLSINTLFLKAGLFNDKNILFNGRLTDIRLSADSIPPYLHPVTLLPWLAENDLTNLDYYLKPFAIDPTIKLMFENNTPQSNIINHVKKIFKYTDTILLPSKEKPLKLNTNELQWGYRFNQILAEKSYLNNPTAKAANYKNFPGEAPDKAPRTKDEEVTIPVKVGYQGLNEPEPGTLQPHSTGFYIPAGARVFITLSEPYLQQGLKAQIGVHIDDLSNLESINRDGADLTRTFTLNKTQTEIYSPYGGLLLIRVPDSTTLKSIKFSLTGAVKAPRFELNKTTEQQWKTTIRNYQAPWAELATENVVFTVPSALIRTLDNPEKLLQFWDSVMDANAELAFISPKRTHPERIIVDSKVAFGYMFATKERIIVPNDESSEVMLDVDRLRKEGSWGHFHEIGHRHQFRDLDFSALSEVSVNLYTLYAYEKVLNMGLLNNEKFPNRQALSNRIDKYFNNAPSFKKWKDDHFAALSMYIQIIDAFGWDSIKKVYSKYRALPKSAYPKFDQDKIDLWFTSICEATNSDMTTFFDIWQIPISETAKQQTKKYASWVPQDMVKYKK